MVLIFVVGVTVQSGFTGLYAGAAKIYPTSLRSIGVGSSIGLGRFGAVIGPGLAGIMIAAGVGMGTNFGIFAIPIFLSGLLAYFLRVR